MTFIGMRINFYESKSNLKSLPGRMMKTLTSFYFTFSLCLKRFLFKKMKSFFFRYQKETDPIE